MGLRDFIDEGGGVRVTAELTELDTVFKTNPSLPHMRGFSMIGILSTEQRNRLSAAILANLMFVSLDGHSLQDFQLMPYVER